MVVYNRSADVTRSRLARFNRQTESLKLRLKLPYAQEGRLRELQETVKAVLEPPPGAAASKSWDDSPFATPVSSGASDSSSSSSSSPAGGKPGAPVQVVTAAAAKKAFTGHPVTPQSVEVVLSKFTDTGVELLVKARLRAEPSCPQMHALLLELSRRVRAMGAVMVNL